jgi:hypothetical protein
MVCWNTGRLREAEGFFQRALETQSAVIAEFPDLPSHNQVLAEFMRLRLGQVCCERSTGAQNPAAPGKSRDLLETCIANLTELTARPELRKDRLAWSSLPVAYEALSHALAEIGENEKAQEAKRSGRRFAARCPTAEGTPGGHEKVARSLSW